MFHESTPSRMVLNLLDVLHQHTTQKNTQTENEKNKTQQAETDARSRIHAAGAFKQTDFDNKNTDTKLTKMANINEHTNHTKNTIHFSAIKHTCTKMRTNMQSINNLLFHSLSHSHNGKTGTMLALILHMIQLNKINEKCFHYYWILIQTLDSTNQGKDANRYS